MTPGSDPQISDRMVLVVREHASREGSAVHGSRIQVRAELALVGHAVSLRRVAMNDVFPEVVVHINERPANPDAIMVRLIV